MTIDTNNSRVGLAELVRAGYIVLLEEMNQAITEENAYWVPLDEQIAELSGQPYVPTVIENVEFENFYRGHNPSLIEAPLERYPNVAVDADRASSSGNDDIDQGSMQGLSLYIEFMVKSEKDEGEVSDRAMRMLDAINAVMMSNRTLGGVVNEISDTPTSQLSDVFVRSGDTSYGENWFWRGGRIEYEISKLAMIPSSGNLTYAGIDIDQA
jgi:hypothetical protein